MKGRQQGAYVGPYKPANMNSRARQRIEAGLTQEEAARLAGVSVRTWRNWEKWRDCANSEFSIECLLARPRQ